jgi:predicted transcriptional regulator
MMSTTSLKLSDAIKASAVEAAKELGISPHAFMVEAIKQAAINAEYRKIFIEEARAARETTIKTNQVFDAQDVFEHLRARIAKTPNALKVKSWKK